MNDQITEVGNVGWADSIAKVLNTTKPKTKKTLVLSRAKKIKLNNEINSNTSEAYDFEIDGGEELIEQKFNNVELDTKIKARTNINLDLRTKPSWKDIEREKNLRKIATKGVVQLFNAVRIQQKEIRQKLNEVGPLDSRKEGVLNNIDKKRFLDVLMSGRRAKSEAVDNPAETEPKTEECDTTDDEFYSSGKSKWGVLKDDYMTNTKVKHWDEEDSNNEE